MRQHQLELRLGIRIDRNLLARLRSCAKELGVPMSKLIRRFLLVGLDSQQPAEQ